MTCYSWGYAEKTSQILDNTRMQRHKQGLKWVKKLPTNQKSKKKSAGTPLFTHLQERGALLQPLGQAKG